ncbi:hypothetical protein, partial [Streptomyces solincola]|uniref:hypothetical protein n=1 Tax=Streptomyces solincola TaxID=2100817 RepID=UPI002159A11E
SGRLREAPGGPPPAWRAHPPAAAPKRRGKGRYAAGLAAVLVLLLLALFPDRVAGWFGGGTQDGGPPSAAGRAAPAAEAERPTPAEPFRGSPAAGWRTGAAGITVPAARATGWMDQAEVARALTRTRDFLALSNLDPAVLRGERPEAAIALVNPHQRDVQDYLAAAFRTPDEENDPVLMFSRFDPAAVRPAGGEVRTRGELSFAQGERGAVEVTADVTFVYPLVRAGGGDEVARTVVRRELVVSWDDPARVETEAGTFTVLSYRTDTANGGCGGDRTGTATGAGDGRGFLRPQFTADRSPADPAAGPAVDPYDRDVPMDELMRPDDGACGTLTRS